MNLYARLVQERTELRAEQDALFAAAERANGLTDSQRTRDDEIAARLGQIDADLQREERRRSLERTAPAVEGATDEAPTPRSDAAPTPFRSFGDQLQAVARAARGVVDPRLSQIQAAAQGSSEAVPSDGGYIVQHDFQSLLIREVFDTGLLSRRARRVPVSGNGLKTNVVKDNSRATGSRWGGIQAFWIAEAGAAAGSKPKFRQIDMSLQKLIGLWYATDEILMDAAAMESIARQAFTEEFGFMVDDAMFRGSGAGVPLGILNSAARVDVAAENAQTADTINALNVEKMYARMPARSLMSAEWYINVACWPQLFAMQDSKGNNLYLPGGNLSGAPFGTLLGRPVTPIEHASALGDVGDITFTDWSQYLLIEKAGQGIQTASSIHVQFLTDETVFRFTLRTNGQPIPDAAITPYKGADTLSPFVALAAR